MWSNQHSGDRSSWDVITRFLNTLLAEPEWLATVAEAEQEIAIKLDASKSNARETIIALMRIGALERVSTGVRRKILRVEQLISLYALRMRIELQALAQIFSMSSTRREALSEDLRLILAHQRKHYRAGDYMGWVLAGFDFHTELVSNSGLADSSIVLRNLLLLIRIGSFRKQTSTQSQEQIMDEHQLYVDVVRDGDTSLRWAAVVEDHLLKSFADGLHSSWEGTPMAGENPEDDLRKRYMLFKANPIWQTTCKMAISNPIAEAEMEAAFRRNAKAMQPDQGGGNVISLHEI